MTDVTIYTRPGCHFCQSAKLLLDSKNIHYGELVVGEDLTAEEFKQLHPLVGYVPYVMVDGNPIGGYTQLVEHLRTTSRFLTEA